MGLIVVPILMFGVAAMVGLALFGILRLRALDVER